MTLTSTLAPWGLLGPPTRNRTAASRFSIPQQTYAPDQWPGCMRMPDSTEPHKMPWASGRPANSPATADSPSGVMPAAPGPPENSGVAAALHREVLVGTGSDAARERHRRQADP